MFDIGFSELMVIAIVALIVIGPERLPKVARTLGHLFGRMQRYVNDVKADISREMELEELKRLQTTVQDAARAFETSVTREVNATESELQKIAQEANATVSLDAPPAAASPAVEDTPAPAVAGQLSAAESSAQMQLELGSSAGDRRA
ncbi:MAG TPA: Sec-independent protein translocase protein TatB [Burkholderiales bacterium]|nr:Sec-independent protein translocase protein TatB [Burkholderiales bacterium]